MILPFLFGRKYKGITFFCLFLLIALIISRIALHYYISKNVEIHMEAEQKRTGLMIDLSYKLHITNSSRFKIFLENVKYEAYVVINNVHYKMLNLNLKFKNPENMFEKVAILPNENKEIELTSCFICEKYDILDKDEMKGCIKPIVGTSLISVEGCIGL